MCINVFYHLSRALSGLLLFYCVHKWPEFGIQFLPNYHNDSSLIKLSSHTIIMQETQEDDKQQEFITTNLPRLSLSQLREIHAILAQDSLLKDVPPSADGETVSRYLAHESGRAVTIYLVRFNGERIRMLFLIILYSLLLI
jgi:hypothetical protein